MRCGGVPERVRGGVRVAALLSLLVVLGACNKRTGTGRELADGGAFELPDSGWFFDASTVRFSDAAAPDTGPFQCNRTCGDAQICGCLDTPPNPTCGCNARAGYAEPCDPQVEDSCKFPFRCVIARKLEGTRYICSDGREGTPCSNTNDTCMTQNGCTCLSTPFGLACSCRGPTTGSALFCDPRVAMPCREGTCVRVRSSPMDFFICSDGGKDEPCQPGDNSCHTSLGCTCPTVAGREVCRCSEPGDVAGDACDPAVPMSCRAPLACRPIPDQELGGFSTVCAGAGTPDGGTDPLACDPMRPSCPPSYECVEVTPGRYRCRLTGM